MKYHFRIKQESIGGYSAQCIELPGCITEADTIKELQENMRAALDLYIEEPESSKDLAALPDESIKLKKNIVEVSVSPQIAFSFMVRRNRILNGLTQQQVAKKMGFDTLYSYQKLETRRANPTLVTLARVKKAFPDFSVDFTINS